MPIIIGHIYTVHLLVVPVVMPPGIGGTGPGAARQIELTSEKNSKLQMRYKYYTSLDLGYK